MRQGPDPRPPSLLVGTPTGFGPKLASRWAEHSLLMWMLQNIFDISCLYSLVYVCYISMTSWLEMAVGLWSLYGVLFTNF